MMKHSVRSLLLLLVVTFTLGPLVGSAQEATVAPTQIATDVRKHLLSLPYYGVFDLLTFNVDNSDVVTIAGYVLSDSLKKDAEREAREAKGVKEVQNKIAVAPVLPMDDDIRHGVYHAIYGDPSLSQYGTPASQFRAMRPGFREWGLGFGRRGMGFGGRGAGFGGPGAGFADPGAGFGGREFGGPHLMGAPFFGYDPVGNYAIHILVNNRAVTLAGVVDSEADKAVAGLKAHGVMNVNQVVNDLEVATKS
jgi:hyperosmotically inducible periplasmic protein